MLAVAAPTSRRKSAAKPLVQNQPMLHVRLCNEPVGRVPEQRSLCAQDSDAEPQQVATDAQPHTAGGVAEFESQSLVRCVALAAPASGSAHAIDPEAGKSRLCSATLLDGV